MKRFVLGLGLGCLVGLASVVLTLAVLFHIPERIIVSCGREKRVTDEEGEVYPVDRFLVELWEGAILSDV